MENILHNLNDHDFVVLARQSKDSNEKMRLLILAHLKEGKTHAAIAEMLKVSTQQVKRTVRRFRTSGIAGLKNQRSDKAGAQRKVPIAHYAAIKAAILAAQSSREGGRMTGHDVQALLRDQWNIHCCLSSVYNLLANLNLVWISSRSRHPKQDEAKQADFKKNLPKRLKPHSLIP